MASNNKSLALLSLRPTFGEQRRGDREQIDQRMGTAGGEDRIHKQASVNFVLPSGPGYLAASEISRYRIRVTEVTVGPGIRDRRG